MWVNGPIHDILGVRYARFPGRELAENTPFQFIGEEYMNVEEYDELSMTHRDSFLKNYCPALAEPLKIQVQSMRWLRFLNGGSRVERAQRQH